ncbi:MAG: protein tyrosine phosphatase family protein [Myxococcales bacterium]|nr:protein tyrosine phosphatase family protein [Myxococcales bacterium]
MARLNRELIEDEGHDNPMDLAQLEARMAAWLRRRYRAVIFFDEHGATVAYALYRDDERGGHHLRQFFVVRERRRRGHGRRAMELLEADVLRTGARLHLEVLTDNAAARGFWQALGFTPYATTLERTSTEAGASAFNFLQATDDIATSGIVPPGGFQRIAAAGYRAVINLLPDDSEHAVAAEAKLVGQAGMAYVHIPVDFGHPGEDDYARFLEAMDEHATARVWAHCAANFRVTAFFHRYARDRLGWSRERADALLACVWEPDQVWRDFLDRGG